MSNFDMPSEAVMRARQQLVLDHFHDEVRHAWDDVLATFPHPHYELIAPMRVYDGNDDVRQYYQESRAAFPDQDHEIIAIRHSHDAVIVEFWLLGTQLGPLGKIPATGGRHRTRMSAYFIFDDKEQLVVERIYFDQLTVLKQLLASLDKKKPRDLVTLLRAVVGLLGMAGEPPDARLTEPTPPETR
jgi:predicted ester cyclase